MRACAAEALEKARFAPETWTFGVKVSPSTAQIEYDLETAVAVFQSNAAAQGLPGFHSFPMNSCERAAALLAVAFRRKYPLAYVTLVRGRNSATDEMHFWVEIDEMVVDPTAEQFEGYSSPLVCERPSPLEKAFPRDEVILDPELLTDLPWNSNSCWSAALDALCRAIAF
jgi:hypothetical protein